jgi:ABC-2 type transport system permease protein
VRALRLLAVFARIGALNELAYRANFWFQAFETGASLATALGAVALVFRQTDALHGWRADELIALLGVYYLVYGVINLVIAPSLSRFMEDVRQGTLDYTLTRPADAQLLVSFSEFRVWRLVDVGLGAAVLAVALARLAPGLGPAHALGFAVALLAGTAIVYGFWILLATCSFWFVRVENITMIFWSMYTAGRWPVGLYPGWLRWTLTLVVPVAFAVTVPAEAIAGRLDAATLAGALALAALLLAASRAFWKAGLRHYSGASA